MRRKGYIYRVVRNVSKNLRSNRHFSLDLPLFVYSVREKSRKDYRVSLTRRGGDRVKFHERLSSSRLVSTFVLEFLFPLPSLARETSAPFFETVTAHTDSPLTSGERPTDTPDQRTE